MPLFEKARVEVYLPDFPKPAYQELLAALDREFTYTIGDMNATVLVGTSYGLFVPIALTICPITAAEDLLVVLIFRSDSA